MLLSLLFSFATGLTTDTLTVGQARMGESLSITQAYRTDSLNMAGKAPDILEILNKNAKLAQQPLDPHDNGRTIITHGTALTVGTDSLPVLRTLHFNLQSPRFTKVQILVNKLAHYKLYVDGKEQADGKIRLTPGRKECAILVLTQKADRDSFNVKVIGDSLSDVTINATGKKPYTMAEMTQGDHYRSVALSPSGKYLITSSYYLKPDGSAQYTTTLTERTGGRELLHRNEYLPISWLDDTTQDVLYYTRSGGKGRELVVYTPHDGQEQVLAENLPDGGFSVSPNKDYLIFNVNEEGKTPTNGLKRLEEPDDRMNGWRNRNALWRYDIKSGLMQRLTFGKAGMWLSDISDDGKKLLLQYSRFDATRRPFDRTTIVMMDAYSGRIDTLLADTTFISSAQFSPTGDQLLIKASPAAFNGLGSEVKPGQVPNAFDCRLYLYDIKTRQTTPLLRHFNPSVENYQWLASNGLIYFVATDGANRRLFSLDPQTLKTTRFELPVTYIQGYSIAKGMKRPDTVFFGQTAERARELFSATLDRATPKSRHIGHINFDNLFANVAIGSCHDWKFQASRGDSIDGFYFLPPDFDASKKYPLIVYYYGGCTPTSKCLEFQYPLQVLAGQGYVVYVPNPSGAIGYGQEFAARHVNTWGKESGDDIIEGTQAFCQAHPYIDPKRIGCMGASYGGFMTEYLQTRTDIFTAAVSHAGISNIASYWGGGYWGYSYGECAQYGSFPWNNPDLYVKHSSLFNADKIQTPLLLLHGTADTNVPTTESQQLYTALKILGREVAYVQVDGENHVITNYPKRMAWQETIFAWFAKYLKKDSSWWDALDL